MFDGRVEQNYEALQQLRRQVESVQQHSTRVSAQAESALSAVEELRADSLDVLRAMQTSVAAQSASAEAHLRTVPARAPSQTELDDVRSRVERLDAKIDTVDAKIERMDAKTERARGQHSTAAGHGLVLEKEVVSMLQRQIESLQADLKAGEQRLAGIDVKCVAALDGAARNRKAAKKLEAKVDGAQERLDTRLDRLAAQAMQRPPPPEEMAESVPPPALGTFSAGPGDSRGSIGLATPSELRGSAGMSAAGATGARGGRGSGGWEEHSAVDGQLYYYNTQTRQTTWTRPVEMSHASTVPQPLPETAEDTVLGGTAARVAALEQVVAEERNQVCLWVPIHLTCSESLRNTCMPVSLLFLSKQWKSYLCLDERSGC
jgi:phage shock protein A|eukprot:COSAG03_NODE_43_length_17034_cov_9.679953_17_plen_375_part_00